MLRQVFVIKKDDIIYQRTFAYALENEEVENLRFKIKQDAIKKLRKSAGYFDYYKYRIVYDVDIDLDLIFIFITGIMDDFFRLTQAEIYNFKNEFLKLINQEKKIEQIDNAKFELLDAILDSMHRNILPKISIVGFSGVGKTTTKNLIKNDEISLRHIPTISGDIATIKIGNLEFSLFDFAGQEQYKYLWKGFIKGSNAVLVITDSSPDNVEKSRYFIDLKEEEAPYAFIAVIGNKQDLPNSMKVENIEKILGLKTYPMIANRRENRGKMIGIIAELLGINIEESPLLSEIIGDEELIAGIKEARNKNISELELDELSVEAQGISIGKEHYFKPVHLLQDLSYEVEYDIKGLKTENTIKTHYNTISATLKNLNDNKEYSYEEFLKNFQDYRRNAFSCKNIMLKQFLEPNFFKLKNKIEEDESVAPIMKKEEDTVLNALLCAYLTKSNPNKFSDFESISKRFKIKDLDTQTVNEINLYYLRILKKLSE